jgi:hypothetical protein
MEPIWSQPPSMGPTVTGLKLDGANLNGTDTDLEQLALAASLKCATLPGGTE